MRIFFLIFLISLETNANVVGNDTQNFSPNTSGLDFVSAQGSETLDPGLFNFGLFLNYTKNSLPKVQDEFGTIVKSKDSLIFSDLSIGYGVTEVVDVGISFSTIHNQNTDRSTSGAQFAQTGLDEIRLNGKYNFFRREDFGMSVVSSFNFNQVRNNPFVGLGAGPTTNVEFITDSKIKSVRIALNLGYRLRSAGSAIAGAYYKPLTDQYIGSIAASYYLPQYDLKWIAELYSAKLVKNLPQYDSDKISTEAIVGFKYDYKTNSSWNFGLGMPVSKGLFTPEQRIFVGLNYAFETERSIKNKEKLSSTHTTVISKYGYQPEDIEKIKNMNFDEILKTHEFVLRTSIDLDSKEADKPPFEVIRLDGFDFDFGSAQIRPEYAQLFDKLVEYLNSEPKVLKIQIEGHTDSIGSPERNRDRSRERSESVRDFLVKKGAKFDFIMQAIGYGPDRPIADNSDYQGRRKNRRVEIRILRQINTVVSKEEKHH